MLQVSGVTLLTLNGSVSLKGHCSLNKTYRFLIWVRTMQAYSTKTQTETEKFAIFFHCEKVSITCHLGIYVLCEFVVDNIQMNVQQSDWTMPYIHVNNNGVLMSLGATLLKQDQTSDGVHNICGRRTESQFPTNLNKVESKQEKCINTCNDNSLYCYLFQTHIYKYIYIKYILDVDFQRLQNTYLFLAIKKKKLNLPVAGQIELLLSTAWVE